MRLPTPVDLSGIRNRFTRSNRKLRFHREAYLNQCWGLISNLKGLPLQAAIIAVASKMRDNGLYSRSISKANIRFSVARYFARLDQGDTFDLEFWEKWLASKRINLWNLKAA